MSKPTTTTLRHAPITTPCEGQIHSLDCVCGGRGVVASDNDEKEALADLVVDFSDALLEKLHAPVGQRHGWADPAWTENDIRDRLLEAVIKGDPVDIAAFAAFLWNRSQP